MLKKFRQSKITTHKTISVSSCTTENKIKFCFFISLQIKNCRTLAFIQQKGSSMTWETTVYTIRTMNPLSLLRTILTNQWLLCSPVINKDFDKSAFEPTITKIQAIDMSFMHLARNFLTRVMTSLIRQYMCFEMRNF
ncbi:hypothetical protein D3C87_1548040 [compost metagenome]